MDLPPGRTGLARVTYEAPDGSGGELGVLDYDVPPKFVDSLYSNTRASPVERERFENDAPPGGVAITFVEPGLFGWEGKRYRLAQTAPRSWCATIGWGCFMPFAVATDVILLPFYVGFGVALLAAR